MLLGLLEWGFIIVGFVVGCFLMVVWGFCGRVSCTFLGQGGHLLVFGQSSVSIVYTAGRMIM